MANLDLNVNADLGPLIDGLNQATKAQSKLTDESKEFTETVNKGFQNAAKGSKDLGNEQKKQLGIIEKTKKEIKELEKARDSANSIEDIKKYNAELEKTEKELRDLQTAGTQAFNKVGDAANKNTGFFGKIGSGFKDIGKNAVGLVKNFAGPAAAIAAVGAGITNGIQTIRQFSKSLDELASITGLDQTSEAFGTLTEEAKRLGSTTTLSANEVVDAFKIVGSAKPELLDNAEALSNVTEQAIILSQASGEELGTSVTALTGILNQFGLDGAAAEQTIDSLANAAQAGAAGIPAVADAITKFGVQAKAANISVNESIAAIEVLADKGIQGAEAGTALRNVLTRISTAKALPKEAVDQLEAFGVNLDLVTDTSLPLNERLREFGKISGDATALVKVFGIENQAAGQILLNNVDRLDDLTGRLETSGTALDQSNQNTDNLDGALKGLSSAWEGLILQFSGGDDVLKDLVNTLSDIIRFVTDNIDAVITLTKVAVNLFTTFKAFSEFQRLQGVFQEATKGVTGFSKGFKGLNAVMRANPIGAIISAVTALISAFSIVKDLVEQFSGGLSEAEVQSKALEDATAKVGEEFRKEATEVDKVFNKLQDANTTREESLQLLEFLEEQYDVTLDDLRDEEGLLTDVEAAQRRVTDAVLDNIIAKQKAEKQNALLEESIKNQVAIQNAQNGVLDETGKSFETTGNKVSSFIDQQGGIIEGGLSALGALFGSEEEQQEAARKVLSIGSDVANKNRERIAEQIQKRNEEIKKELAVIDKTFEGAAAAVKDNFKDLQFGLADGLKGEAAEVPAAVKQATEAEKKAREKARRERKKLEEDFLKALIKLEQDAAKQIIDNIEDPIEKLKAQQQAALDEVNAFAQDLKNQAAALGKELTEEQLSQIDILVDGVNAKFEKQIKEVELDLLVKEVKVSQDAIKEELSEAQALEQLDIAEKELELKKEFFGQELEFEKARAEAITAIRIQAAEEQIELLKRQGDLASLEQAAQLEKTVLELKEAQQKAKELEDNAPKLQKLLGLSDEEFAQVKDALSKIGQEIVGAITEATDRQLEANQSFIDGINSRIDEAGSALEREIALNEAGFASNVEAKRNELQALQKQREEALKEQEKLRRRQAILEKAQQIGSLATAVAQILASEASKGVIGLLIAAAAIPTLFALFSAAKSKAQTATEGFAHGGYTGPGGKYELAGDVHRGEFVFTQEKTNKHRPLFEAIHNDNLPAMQSELMGLLEGTGVTINKSTPEKIKTKTIQLHNVEREHMASAISAEMLKHLESMDENLDGLGKFLKNQEKTEIRGDKKVIKKGNVTRFIKIG